MKKHASFIGPLLLTILAVSVVIVYYRFIDHPIAHLATEGKLVGRVNQPLTIPIVLDTGSETINAAEVHIKTNPKLATITAVSKDSSFFQIWIKDQPSFSAQDGTATFAGGLPKPGFTGKGRIGSLTLIPHTTGQITLTFTNQTQVLRNDGQGTKIPLAQPPIMVSVKH
jgi:hypothetical protein